MTDLEKIKTILVELKIPHRVKKEDIYNRFTLFIKDRFYEEVEFEFDIENESIILNEV